jgi:D-threonate/D-erythronate kinase
MIGVIADDLTGAAEIGAVGLRHGLRAEIVRRGKPSGTAEVVCVDTDSRSCSADEAGKRAASAAKRLSAAGAQWIYKKVDSVLRGQVTAEVEAVMKQLQLNRALLLPANPSLGRVIRDGQYFVRGKLIHKTEFARDPEYPRRVSQVLQLLKLPEKFLIRLANGDHTLADGTIVVGEAATPGDVRAWAAHREAGMLPAGGSDFFSALLDGEHFPTPAGEVILPQPSPGRELFVCGTFTESVRKFVNAARRRKTPVFSLPQELRWGVELSAPVAEAITRRVTAAFDSHARVILNVGLPPVRDIAVARRLSHFVVQIAGLVLRRVRIANVFAEGGATSAELVRCMGWARLTVQREHAPGVATLAVEGGKSILLTIKPGTYAWPAKWT